MRSFTKNRIEAFSDGVLAIIITIMVLEMKVPHGSTEWEALIPLVPVFFSYLLSFIYLAIYWNNHHHMLHTCERVTGKILWANMHLLFWLSLVPFSTGWMGENHFDPKPTALYGVTLLGAGFAYWVLQTVIIQSQGEHSLLKKMIRKDWKGKLSLLIYTFSILLSMNTPWVAICLYSFVALLWLVPDQRIEKSIRDY